MAATLRIMATTAIAIIMTCLPLAAQGIVDPLVHPIGTIGVERPYFIWQDIYNTKDGAAPALYRITVRPKGPAAENAQKDFSFTTNPDIMHNSFYAFQIPTALTNGAYGYTIERIFHGRPVDAKYYHYLRYPIQKTFTIDTARADDIGRLAPQNLIRYLYLSKENTITNGYNSLFFAGSGAVSLGIGILFATVIDFGVVSTVLSVVSFASATAGITASAWYGYRYFSNRNKLRTILETGAGTSLKGGMDKDSAQVEMELRF